MSESDDGTRSDYNTQRGSSALRRPMRGRDPDEKHRSSSALELLFDLCFVVAVSQAAAQLHHALVEGHLGSGLLRYAAVFFTIWWAWMNFTWFASAYDTDDVLYRVLTLLQMAGVLVLAAGAPAAFQRYDFTVITFGYVIMRVAMIGQWLRAAIEDRDHRSAALRYAAGVGVVQAAWVARIWAPHSWSYATFVVLVIAELAVPVWAEFRGARTSWHPGHIKERYGAFTIIVLGEVILATLTALQSVEHSLSALVIAVGGLLLVFGLWWIYFTDTSAGLTTLRTALTWGYGHYIVFAAVAALGAGLQAALDTTQHQAHVSDKAAAFAVAVPVCVSVLMLALLHPLTDAGSIGHHLAVGTGAIAILTLAWSTPVFGVDGAVLAMGVALAATLVVKLIRGVQARTRTPAEDSGP